MHEISTIHKEHLLYSLLMSQVSELLRMKGITEAKCVKLQNPEIIKQTILIYFLHFRFTFAFNFWMMCYSGLS